MTKDELIAENARLETKLSATVGILSTIEEELAGTYDTLNEDTTASNESRVRMAALSIGHAYGLAKYGATL
jgi:hypothetical protein